MKKESGGSGKDGKASGMDFENHFNSNAANPFLLILYVKVSITSWAHLGRKFHAFQVEKKENGSSWDIDDFWQKASMEDSPEEYTDESEYSDEESSRSPNMFDIKE